jgi:hypothetical protein
VTRLRNFSNLVSLAEGDHIRADYRIRNMGSVPIHNITAEIAFTSDNLRPVRLAYDSVEAPRVQRISLLGPGDERHIYWLLYAWKPGRGEVHLEVRSEAGVQRLQFAVVVG